MSLTNQTFIGLIVAVILIPLSNMMFNSLKDIFLTYGFKQHFYNKILNYDYLFSELVSEHFDNKNIKIKKAISLHSKIVEYPTIKGSSPFITQNTDGDFIIFCSNKNELNSISKMTDFTEDIEENGYYDKNNFIKKLGKLDWGSNSHVRIIKKLGNSEKIFVAIWEEKKIFKVPLRIFTKNTFDIMMSDSFGENDELQIEGKSRLIAEKIENNFKKTLAKILKKYVEKEKIFFPEELKTEMDLNVAIPSGLCLEPSISFLLEEFLINFPKKRDIMLFETGLTNFKKFDKFCFIKCFFYYKSFNNDDLMTLDSFHDSVDHLDFVRSPFSEIYRLYYQDLKKLEMIFKIMSFSFETCHEMNQMLHFGTIISQDYLNFIKNYSNFHKMDIKIIRKVFGKMRVVFSTKMEKTDQPVTILYLNDFYSISNKIYSHVTAVISSEKVLYYKENQIIYNLPVSEINLFYTHRNGLQDYIYFAGIKANKQEVLNSILYKFFNLNLNPCSCFNYLDFQNIERAKREAYYLSRNYICEKLNLKLWKGMKTSYKIKNLKEKIDIEIEKFEICDCLIIRKICLIPNDLLEMAETEIEKLNEKKAEINNENSSKKFEKFCNKEREFYKEVKLKFEHDVLSMINHEVLQHELSCLTENMIAGRESELLKVFDEITKYKNYKRDLMNQIESLILKRNKMNLKQKNKSFIEFESRKITWSKNDFKDILAPYEEFLTKESWENLKVDYYRLPELYFKDFNDLNLKIENLKAEIESNDMEEKLKKNVEAVIQRKIELGFNFPREKFDLRNKNSLQISKETKVKNKKSTNDFFEKFFSQNYKNFILKENLHIEKFKNKIIKEIKTRKSGKTVEKKIKKKKLGTCKVHSYFDSSNGKMMSDSESSYENEHEYEVFLSLFSEINNILGRNVDIKNCLIMKYYFQRKNYIVNIKPHFSTSEKNFFYHVLKE